MLEKHSALINELTNNVKDAVNNEPIEGLKPIRALEALLDGLFSTAAKGPEFIMPAIAAFHKVAEEQKSVIKGVTIPTLEEIADKKIAEKRDAVMPFTRVL